MERQKVRSLMSLVRVAFEEVCAGEFSFLRPLMKKIEQGSELNADIVTIATNYNKSKYELRPDPLNESTFSRTDYLGFMARGLFTFNSQVKYIEFSFRDTAENSATVHIRFSELRSPSVQCVVSIKAKSVRSSKFVVIKRFAVSQFPEDGPVTVRDSWFIRLLKWMVSKVVPQEPTPS